MNLLAVDLGGSHASCGLILNDSLVACDEVSLPDNSRLAPALSRIADAFRSLLQRYAITVRSCDGIAFSFCGLVDPRNLRILATNGKYDDHEHLDLLDWARSNFSLPLRLENDARLALLGEWHAGAGRGFNDIVMVTLGTGIGVGVLLEGHLVRGKHAQAGCLGGHFTVNHQGRRCGCGNIGCMEAEASTWALPTLCRDYPHYLSSPLAQLPRITFADVFRYCDSADPCAMAVRDHCLKVWGAGTVSLIHAYDPELVIFGGGCMKSSDQILPAIGKYIQDYAWTPWGHVQVRKAELGGRAALLGALPLFQRSLT